jgi:hypothetical protein
MSRHRIRPLPRGRMDSRALRGVSIILLMTQHTLIHIHLTQMQHTHIYSQMHSQIHTHTFTAHSTCSKIYKHALAIHTHARIHAFLHPPLLLVIPSTQQAEDVATEAGLPEFVAPWREGSTFIHVITALDLRERINFGSDLLVFLYQRKTFKYASYDWTF